MLVLPPLCNISEHQQATSSYQGRLRSRGVKLCDIISVAVRNRYTSRFTAASIWEILSLIVLLTRDPRRTSTHQLAEHEDCIKGEQKILLTN